MSDRSAAIGLASDSDARPPPKASAWRFDTKDHVTASIMPRAARVRLARRVRFCRTVRTAEGTCASRGNGVTGIASTPAMRMTSSTRSALPSMSGRQLGAVTSTTGPSPRTANPSAPRMRLVSSSRNSESGQPSHLREREGDQRPESRLRPGDEEVGRRSPAELDDEFGRKVGSRDDEGGIHAAFEAVPGIAVDAEQAAGPGDVERLPERRLDQNVRRALVAAGPLSPHDAGNRTRRRCRRR